jgi:cell division protein FtsB
MKSDSQLTRRRSKHVRWLAAAALLLVAFLINEVAGQGGYLARLEQRRQIDALTSDIERLRKENEQLSVEIRSLREDPAAIEQYAREQLHLARPGELVIALPPSSPPADTASR